MSAQIIRAPAWPRAHRSAALGVAKYLWMRFYRIFGINLVFWMFSAFAGHLMVAGKFGGSSDAADFARQTMIMLTPGALMLAPILAIFAIDEALWILPIPTKTLVGGLMFALSFMSALFVVANMVCIWRPAGFDAPIWWPAAMAATQSVLYAARCQPIAGGALRAAVYALALATLLSGVAAMAIGAPPPIIAAGYSSLIPMAYFVAVAGARRTRRGDLIDAPRTTGKGAPKALREKFVSEFHAQLSWETRPSRFFLAGFVIFAGACTLPLLAAPLDTDLGVITILTHGGRHIKASMWAGLGPGFIAMAALCYALAQGIGIGLGPCPLRYHKGKGPAGPSFPAYPIAHDARVAVKLRIAAVSSLAAVAAMTPFLLLWLALPGVEGMHKDTLGAALWSALGDRAISITMACYVLTFLILWKIQTDSLFLTLTGREWVLGAAFVLVLVPVYIPFYSGQASELIGRLFGTPSDHRLLNEILFVAVLTKLMLLAYLAAVLRRRRMLTARALSKMASVWGISALALFTLICAAFAPQYLDWREAAGGAILLMPGVRIALAPLALAWDRSR